jgi:DNA repair photolyase
VLEDDKITQSILRLERERDQIVEEYGVRLEQIQQSLKMNEKKHYDVRNYNLTLKQERDEVKNKLMRETIRYNNCFKQEHKLDAEIEDVIGRVVSMNDLTKLYNLDMKTIAKINNNKSS